MLQKGDRVRMTAAFKEMLRGQCGQTGKHVGPVEDGNCPKCSSAHVDEFGECIGVVQGWTDYNNAGEPYDPAKVGPEVDVRWEPSMLRYGYHPDWLEKVDG